jgi:predicted NUDIX family NTP pyrophosphohydrolase
MTKQSAGLIMYRVTQGSPQVLLVHPGGPFWAKKTSGHGPFRRPNTASGTTTESCDPRVQGGDDRAGWFTIQEVTEHILKGQAALLEALAAMVMVMD